MNNLMSRDSFRETVFNRDNHKCVVCQAPAIDAHHILERRLWQDGGYYLDNGVSVCQLHHVQCEQTLISVEQIREYAGIKSAIIPEHLYPDTIYDKWGNIILENGLRIPGELFYDESVQKILKQGKVLDSFTNRIKYPRTYHLPWSPGINDDDRVIKDITNFVSKEVVITEKMDGENTTVYPDGYVHARSITSNKHWSRSWIKSYIQNFAYDIPKDHRICGESLYAKHSIKYVGLPCYFIGFSIWNKLTCLSWSDTIEWFDLLGLVTPRVLYQGIFNEKLIRDLGNKLNFETQEGYVMRITDNFSYGDFKKSVAKFVRPDHVKTTKHWFHGSANEINLLKDIK